MPLVEAEAQAARRQLERVLESPGFAHNERMSRFLRFVVERHLEGRDHELKESVIGVEIFGRRPDYNPKHDPIVRTEAGRLRSRLSEFYISEGKGDALIIELPKGGYAPVIRQPETAPATTVPLREPAVRSRLGIRLWLTIALACLAPTGWWWVHRTSAPVTIAVLPLENLSHDPANDYFADGLTGELIRNLSIIEGLAVRSQTSSFALRGKPRNLREAGQKLYAAYILEGSVLRLGRRLRINVQLVRVRDDFALWSDKFDRELTDIFAIQDEISRGIVNQLRLQLGYGRRRYETSVEAYDLYLRARAMSIPEGLYGRIQSIKIFDQAITKDPSFAPAWAGLGGAYALRSIQFQLDHPFDELVKMRAAAEKAIQLDPLLPEAHDALAMAQARDGQWERAERSFRRAIELDPNGSGVHADYAMWFLTVLGRNSEALQQLKIAAKSDPLSPEVPRHAASVLISTGRFDEAVNRPLEWLRTTLSRSGCWPVRA